MKVDKSIHGDIRMLARMDKAVRATTPRMRRAVLEFLWDKYVTHAASREDEEARIGRAVKFGSKVKSRG